MAITMQRALNQFGLLLLLAALINANNPWAGMSIYCNKQTYRMPASKEGCTSQRFAVSACLGLCQSYVKIEAAFPHFKNLCMCCKPSGIERKTFQFTQCNAGIDKSIQIDSATGCSCQHVACH